MYGFIKNAYVAQVNKILIKKKNNIICEIDKCTGLKTKQIDIKFSSMKKQNMHPQDGVSQLYHDQMSIIGQHFFYIQDLDDINNVKD